MINMRQVYELIDQLPRQELEQLNRYIQQRRATTVWEVPAAQLKAIEELMRPTHERAATMSEDEINAILDEAIAEVRRERKTQSSA